MAIRLRLHFYLCVICALLVNFYRVNVVGYGYQVPCDWNKTWGFFISSYNNCNLQQLPARQQIQSQDVVLIIEEINACFQDPGTDPAQSIGQFTQVLGCLWSNFSVQGRGQPVNSTIIEGFADIYDLLLNESDEVWSSHQQEFSLMLFIMDEVMKSFIMYPGYRNMSGEKQTQNIIIKWDSSDKDIRFNSTYASNSTQVDSMIPKIFLSQDAYKNNSDKVSYAVIVYKNVTGRYRINSTLQERYPDQSLISNKIFHSSIVSFSLSSSLQRVSPPLTITFTDTQQSSFYDPVCAFLDTNSLADLGLWSQLYKTVKSYQGDQVDCLSDHLTNFAVLVSLEPKETVVLNIISIIGCAISIFCLLVTIIVYFLLWRYVKGCWSVLHLNLCVWLILAYVVFLAGVDRTEHVVVCKVVSVLLHFIFLVVFFIMLCEGIMVFISVTCVFKTRMLLKAFLPPAYCIPLIIVVICLGLTETKGYGSEKSCWIVLDLKSGLTWAFIGPVLFVLLVNFIILLRILVVILSRRQVRKTSHPHRLRSAVRTICILSPLLGFTWVFGVISVTSRNVAFQYLFAVFNSLQGMFVFICHCLLHPQIREGWRATLYKQNMFQRWQETERSPNSDPAELDEGHLCSSDLTFDMPSNGTSSINYYRNSQEGQGRENPMFDSFYTKNPKNSRSSEPGEDTDNQPGSLDAQARSIDSQNINPANWFSDFAAYDRSQTPDTAQDLNENTKRAAEDDVRKKTSIIKKIRRLSAKFRDSQKDEEKLKQIYVSMDPVPLAPYSESGQNQGIKHRARFVDTDLSSPRQYREPSAGSATPASYTRQGT